MARHRMQLAFAGRWGRDAAEITEEDLREVVETFRGKKPAVIGHVSGEAAPKFGDVEGLSLADGGRTLLGSVNLLDEAERLYKAGYYDGWSVSIPRRGSDGKRYLHHLAFLGATPPKIAGLEELPMEKVADYGEGEAAESFAFGGKIKEAEVTHMGEEEKKKEEGMQAGKEREEIERLKKENEGLKKKLAELEKKKDFSDSEEKKEANYADVQKEIASLKEANRKARLTAFEAKAADIIPAGLKAKTAALANLLSGAGSCGFADDQEEDALSVFGDILAAAFSGRENLTKNIFDAARDGDEYSDSDAAADYGKIAAKL